jgi:hypothetical protein
VIELSEQRELNLEMHFPLRNTSLFEAVGGDVLGSHLALGAVWRV